MRGWGAHHHVHDVRTFINIIFPLRINYKDNNDVVSELLT